MRAWDFHGRDASATCSWGWENRTAQKIAALQAGEFTEMSLEGNRLRKVLAPREAPFYPSIAARVVGNGLVALPS
ncbi:MAG: hypothetical protein LC118_19895 [Dehalococcoidia bacterium]|nr:hypothetical protein [Dehalococcoidia bacterium]